MNFAQSSFIYFNYTLQEAIRRLHDCGYQGIEVWGGRPHAYRHDLDEQLDGLRALLDAFGMTVPNFIPAQFRYPSILCSLNERVRNDSVAYIEDAIRNAAALGSRHISLCPGMTLAGEDLAAGWAQLRKSFLELLAHTQGTDMVLLIEPAHRFESTLILTVADGLRMIEEIGSDRLGILLDTGHAAVNGEDLAAVVRGLQGVPFHIHIDDNFGDNDAHLIPGDGRIDFAPFVRALREVGYRGSISAELGFQYVLDPDPAVEKTLRALETMFGAGRAV